MLLSNNVNVNEQNKQGLTPLHIAVKVSRNQNSILDQPTKIE